MSLSRQQQQRPQTPGHRVLQATEAVVEQLGVLEAHGGEQGVRPASAKLHEHLPEHLRCKDDGP